MLLFQSLYFSATQSQKYDNTAMSKKGRNVILHSKMYEISSKVETIRNIVSYNTKGFVFLGCCKGQNVQRLKRRLGKSTNKNEILSVTIKDDGLQETSSSREPYKPLITSTGGKARTYIFAQQQMLWKILDRLTDNRTLALLNIALFYFL